MFLVKNSLNSGSAHLSTRGGTAPSGTGSPLLPLPRPTGKASGKMPGRTKRSCVSRADLGSYGTGQAQSAVDSIIGPSTCPGDMVTGRAEQCDGTALNTLLTITPSSTGTDRGCADALQKNQAALRVEIGKRLYQDTGLVVTGIDSQYSQGKLTVKVTQPIGPADQAPSYSGLTPTTVSTYFNGLPAATDTAAGTSPAVSNTLPLSSLTAFAGTGTQTSGPVTVTVGPKTVTVPAASGVGTSAATAPYSSAAGSLKHNYGNVAAGLAGLAAAFMIVPPIRRKLSFLAGI